MSKYLPESETLDVLVELPNCYPLKVFADGLKLSGASNIEFRFYPAGMIIYSTDNIDNKYVNQMKIIQHHCIEISYKDMSKYYYFQDLKEDKKQETFGKSPRQTSNGSQIIKTVESISLQKALKNLSKSDGIRIEVPKSENSISISSNQTSKNGTTNSIKCIESYTPSDIITIEDYISSNDEKFVHSLPSTNFSLSFNGHSVGKNDKVEIKIYNHGKIYLGNMDNCNSVSKSCSKFEESYINSNIMDDIKSSESNPETKPIVKYVIPRNICKLFTKFTTMNPHGVVKIYGGVSSNGTQLPFRVINKFGSMADYEFMLIMNDEGDGDDLEDSRYTGDDD
jgi:hypothetical protein